MLMLTRRPGERIFILNEKMEKVEICLTVNFIRGGQVSIGIDADESYTILREEVFLRNAKGLRDVDQDYEGEDAA